MLVPISNLLLKAYNFMVNQDAGLFQSLSIETTTYCNRRCIYCPNSTNPTPDIRMSKDVFSALMYQLRKIHYIGWVNWGFYNEPMSDERLPDLVADVRRSTTMVRQTVYTNGDYLTQDFVDKLIYAGVHLFVVSTHGGGTLNRRLFPLVNRYPQAFMVRPIDASTNGLSNRGGAVNVTTQPQIQTACNVGSLMVMHNGDVVLCCNDYFRQHVFGNVDKEGLQQIWHKPSFRGLRRKLLMGQRDIVMCKKCIVHSIPILSGKDFCAGQTRSDG